MAKRRMIFFRDEDHKKLSEICKETGLNFSAVIRLALSEYHEAFLIKQHKRKRLTQR
jgi:hypothetical protein